MTEQASLVLGRGAALSRAAVGKTILHRPRQDVAFPLVVGAMCGVLALGLFVAAVVITGALPTTLLAVLELLIAAGLGWIASWSLADALAAHRFNRRGTEVRFELGQVELRSVDRVERVALADAPTHPFLRSLSLDPRLHALMRVRAACERLPPGADVRVVLETLALQPLDDEHVSIEQPAPPPPRPCYAAIVRGEVIVFREPEDLERLRKAGTPVYRIDTDWDPEARTYAPRLTPAGVRRV